MIAIGDVAEGCPELTIESFLSLTATVAKFVICCHHVHTLVDLVGHHSVFLVVWF